MVKHYLIGEICRKCPRANSIPEHREFAEGYDRPGLFCKAWWRFRNSWAFIKVEVPQDCGMYLEYVLNEHKNEEVEDLEIEF